MGDGRCGIGRTAASEDVDLVKHPERVDRAQQKAQSDRIAQAGQGDVNEFLYLAGAVDSGCLVLLGRDRLNGGVQQQKTEGCALPDVDNNDDRHGRSYVKKPVVRLQAKRCDDLIDNAVVAAKHDLPNQRSGNRGQQIGNEEQNTYQLSAFFQAVNKYCQQDPAGCFQYSAPKSKFDRIEQRTAEITILEQGNVVFELNVFQRCSGDIIVVCEAVIDRESNGEDAHDKQNEHGRTHHPLREPLIAVSSQIPLPESIVSHNVPL